MDKTREKREWRLSLFLTESDEAAGTRRFLAQCDKASRARAGKTTGSKSGQSASFPEPVTGSRDKKAQMQTPAPEKEALEFERDLLEGELEILLETEPALFEETLGEMELETAVLEVETIDLAQATEKTAETPEKPAAKQEEGVPAKRRRRRRRGRGKKPSGEPGAGSGSSQQ